MQAKRRSPRSRSRASGVSSLTRWLLDRDCGTSCSLPLYPQLGQHRAVELAALVVADTAGHEGEYHVVCQRHHEGPPDEFVINVSPECDGLAGVAGFESDRLLREGI